MLYRVRRADVLDHDDMEHLHNLHKITFENSAPVKDDGGVIFERGAWWLLYPEDHEDQPVGFCGAVQSTMGPTYAYLKRAGVLRAHRGQGLQKRLIRVREQWARKGGFKWMITNANNDNVRSINSLVSSGYRAYWPPVPWDFRTAVYFRKRLQGL